MKNSLNRWMSSILLLSIFALLAFGGSSSVKVAAQSRQPVLVTNTSQQPVPVQVYGTSAVQAQQTGTWNVNVTDVVPNKDINNIAHDPFATRVYPTVQQTVSFTVPAHKRLVINQFSGYDLSSGNVLDYVIYTTTNGAGGALVIPVTTHNGGYGYAIQPICLIADPGTTVSVAVDDSNSQDPAGVNVDIHGYYVDSY
ncbi:MAG TPA: hypothetical protein VGL56_18520 [Fimbriimonadaceae bacterium]|jgi:hypothetical protein